MSEVLKITTPLSDEVIARLKAGDKVRICGVLYAARDAAHKRMMALMDNHEELPVDLRGQIIYYVGPTPEKPGQVIGSAGPTTSSRMDPYTPRLLAEKGLKGTIGKGWRSPEVKEAMKAYRAVYFGAIGGAGALIARSIKKSDLVAYEDLGPEAIRRLEVEDFPAIVINDIYGGDLYEDGIKRYARI